MRRPAAAALAAAILAGGCTGGTGGAPELEGLWESEGYGLYLDVSGGIDVYEHTAVSCALVASGPERGSGEILGLEGGRLVLAETNETIRFDRLDALPAACGERFATDDPARVVEVLVATMEEHYAFFDLRGAGWAERAAAAAAAAPAAAGEDALFSLVAGLLGPLGDAQVRVAGLEPGTAASGTWSSGSPGDRVAALAGRLREGRVPGLSDVEVLAHGGVVAGWLPGGVGYLAVNRLAGFGDTPEAEEAALAEALSSSLARFTDAGGLVLDLRVDRGGRESLAMLVASRFVPGETTVASRSVRVGGTDRYVDVGDLIVRPLPAGPFPAPLAVLTGPGTVGAAEVLVLALREVPGTVIVGSPTAGSLSPLLVRALPNGWTLGLSHQRVLDARGVLWEGSGIPVDVEEAGEATADRDPVLEAALSVLSGG